MVTIENRISTLGDEIIRRMKLFGYPHATVAIYQHILDNLADYMRTHGWEHYSPSVGEAFLLYIHNEVPPPKSTNNFGKVIISRLNSCLADDFWLEDYVVTNYAIKSMSLQELYDKLCLDLEIRGVKEDTKRHTKLCVCRLDVFMYENNVTEYSLLIGKRFIEYMETHSKHTETSFSYIYTYNIKRLDFCLCAGVPYGRIPEGYEIKNPDIRECLDQLQRIFFEKQYKENSIKSAVNIIKQLDVFMCNKGLCSYTTTVGNDFLDFYERHIMPRDEDGAAVPVIAHFNDVFAGRFYQRYHVKKDYSVLSEFSESFIAYIGKCEENGNRPTTLRTKELECNKFFKALMTLGLSDIHEITTDYVVEACSIISSSAWGPVREYLLSCLRNGFIDRDYTYLVPIKKQRAVVPPYYTKEERLKLQEAPDRNTPIGKRDYAIILIANRLGLRRSDIVNLSFCNIGADKKRIQLDQYKTKNPLELPLLEEIETAIEDYVQNGRPKSTSEKIFLMSCAPYEPLKPVAIHGIITKNLLLAGVDISNRKHGPHALRASLGTDMVNTGRSYEQVRHTYGHKDKDVVQHYVRLDIKHLRQCAVKPLLPTGNFMKALRWPKGGFDEWEPRV